MDMIREIVRWLRSSGCTRGERSLCAAGRLASVAVLSLVFTLSYAQPKADYYTATTLDGKSGRNLELALRDIIYPHTKVKYNHLWEAYETTDPGPADSIPSGHGQGKDLVYDMYAWMSQFPKFYSDKDHSQTGGINREHSVPNSWWGGEAGNDIAYTDLHHLVPGDGAANNAKQNYPLGEYKPGMTLSWPTETKSNEGGSEYMKKDGHDHSQMPCHANASHVWNVVGDGYGGADKVFEPADQYKGDFARMYLYVVCAYEGIDWKVTHMFETVGGHTEIRDWALDLLLKWHRDDPVSDKERARNNAVESIQGNRNPFIDYPDLVEHVWGNKKNEAFSLEGAASAYDSRYSTRPSAEWKLDGTKVASIEAECGEPFTSPTLEVTAQGTYATTYTSSDGDVATIGQTGNVTIKAAGTTTITATVTSGGDTRSEAIASYILTVVKSKDVACYLLETFDGNTGTGGNAGGWSGNIAQASVKSDDSDWSFTKGFGANKCIKLGSGNEAGAATTPELTFTGDAIITFRAGAWNGESEVTTMNISATTGTLSQSSVTLGKGSWTEYRLYITGVTGTTQITFAASANKSNRFFLDEVSITSGYVRGVNTANIGTLCLPRVFEKPSTMTLYNIVSKDADKIYYEENTEDIVAGRPYLFRSTEANVVLSFRGNETAAGSHNGLVGSFEGCTIPENDGNYILSGNRLYIVDGPFSCGTNRAYIHLADVPESSGVKAALSFELECEDPTGIVSVRSLSPEEASGGNTIYNLNGVRVNSNYKGIVIVNGKKCLIK